MFQFHFYSLPFNICQVQATLQATPLPPMDFRALRQINALAKGLAEAQERLRLRNIDFLIDFAKIFRTRPNASERIQVHPSASERMRTGPGRSQQVREPQKCGKNLQKLAKTS